MAVNSRVAASVLGSAVTDYRASFDAAAAVGMIDVELATALKPSVGLCNIIIHGYLDVDVTVVALAIPLARRDYGLYAAAVATWLAARGDAAHG